MLNWIRDYFSRRSSGSRAANRSLDETESNSKARTETGIPSNMIVDNMPTPDANEKVRLNVIYEGDIWIINADKKQLLSEFLDMAITHFFDPKDSHTFASKYRLISVSPKKVLNLLFSIGDEGLKNGGK